MTATTVELNPGSGGSKPVVDSLSTLDGVSAPAGAVAQLIKLIFGTAGDGRSVSEAFGLPVSQTSPLFWRVGFAEVGSGLQGLAAAELDLIQTGAGMAVNQSGGNLVITTGTTVNSETVIRSKLTFHGALLARYKCILSQRIANQTFRFELADLVGSALPYTINSSTSVTVTMTGLGFSSADVGKSLRLSALSSVGIPGRFAVASVTGDNVTFTVAGWPASGSGTLTAYGANYIQSEYSGTTATNTAFDAQRRGWNSGATNATISTTASPGHVGQIAFDVLAASYADSLVATNAGFQWTPRASRIENIPDEDVPMYFFLVVQNGSTAPASTTALTVGFLMVEDQPRNKVRVSGSDPSASHALPVQLMGGTTGVTGTLTVNQGTMVALPAGTAAIGAVRSVLPETTADVASAAITTTTTTAAFTPTAGHSYEVNIPVTAQGGTSPTLDVSIEESDDAGTNWFKVYDFPRITATGMYRSPKIPLTGNRVRYVQTVGGTSPSFTRAINRLMSSDVAQQLRQLIDRTIALTTLNSTTPNLDVRHCRNLQLVLNLGAATTPPAIQIEGSDDNGGSWYAIGSPLTGVASSSVQVTVNNVQAALARGRISTVGATVTPGYVLLKGF